METPTQPADLRVYLPKLPSDGSNVFRSRSLGSLSFREGDLLSFVKIFESHSIEIRHVEEQVFARPSVDKTESSVSDFFDRTF